MIGKVKNNIFVLFVLLLSLTSCSDEQELRCFDIENQSQEEILATVNWDMSSAWVYCVVEGRDSELIEVGETARFEHFLSNKYQNSGAKIYIGIFRRSTLLKYSREELLARGFDEVICTTLFELRSNGFKYVYYGD